MQFRIAAYGEVRDENGRVLLTRRRRTGREAGPWHLPGGVIDHGEPPKRAAERLVGEHTGYEVAVGAAREAVAVARRGVHTNAIIYTAEVAGGPEFEAAGEDAEWVDPARAAAEPHSPFVSACLGLADDRLAGRVDKAPQETRPVPPSKAKKGRRRRGQRFGAYGVVADVGGRVLLARIAEGYPGGGTWHLPGGGVDFGESPRAAVSREIYEETGQEALVGDLLNVTSFRHRRAIGPEGYPLDWHGVRAIYSATVPDPSAAQVVEAAGGSTSESRWWDADALDGLPLSAAVEDALQVVDLKNLAAQA
ncbi:NUDIX domain-containing protein [Glycomyces sp. A-F 0318]|uniref:NUDIX domain-containing protein n=1 Tax=Glycomyces amatae TaxID=2881355 RepID=UPI001E4AAB24|nr:NUDIX domain-containing protein [Glycomyces amatae]MCD0445593.1 NUDIX domain-containing protein [Glycomyces amatae]